jgi:aminoglycoside/choline kinase family phosphotransferase
MTKRDLALMDFLNATGWSNAERIPLRQDASKRRYFRITSGNRKSAIVMDIPPDASEKPDDIIRLTNFLGSIHLGAPEIYDVDLKNGFLIVEDLGESRFADEFLIRPDLQEPRYNAAIDMLAFLQSHQPEFDLPRGDPHTLSNMVDPLFKHYCLCDLDFGQKQSLIGDFRNILERVWGEDMVISLRDCHAENLIWANNNSGLAQVGIIDFQDAFMTHPIYDVVSLLCDVRRDIDPQLREQLIDRYVDQSKRSKETVLAAFHAISVQRNLRILGVFGQLAQNGRTHYLEWAPRAWSFVNNGLNHPSLEPIAQRIRDIVPEPKPEHLERIKSC